MARPPRAKSFEARARSRRRFRGSSARSNSTWCTSCRIRCGQGWWNVPVIIRGLDRRGSRSRNWL